MLGQVRAVARVLVDERVFGQEPIQKYSHQYQYQIEQTFERFKHFGLK